MSLVYILQNGDEPVFKIGLTHKDEAETRKKALSTGNPNRLRIFDTIETEHPRECEAYFHRVLAARQITGGHAKEFYAIPGKELKPIVEEARIYIAEYAALQPELERLEKVESSDQLLPPGNEDLAMVTEIRECRQKEDVIRLRRELLEAKLKIRIGGSAGIDGVATWKTVKGTTFDKANFKAQHGDLYEEYQKPTQSRRFNLA